MPCFDAVNAVNFLTFSANGSYVTNTDAILVHAVVVGGGAAGGGLINGDSALASGGAAGGGGAGGEAEGYFTIATIGASQSITVGQAGAGVNNAPGTNGTATSFGTLLTANGGVGGLNHDPTNGTWFAQGGVGGGASGGDQSFTGKRGETGAVMSGHPARSGAGGDGYHRSGGGRSLIAAGSSAPGADTNGALAGANASGYGAGGGGAVCVGNWGNSVPGGYGSNGAVFITEFLSTP